MVDLVIGKMDSGYKNCLAWNNDMTFWLGNIQSLFSSLKSLVNELYSLGSQVQIYRVWTYNTIYMGLNPLHSVSVTLVRKKFYSDTMFPGTAPLGNEPLRVCFSDHYDLYLFKSIVDCYLSYIL